MAGFLADLAKTYVDRVINGAITESRYLCCFTCIAKEFEEEKAKLKAERETMAQRFDVATRRDKDIQGNALFWKKQVDKLLQEDTTAKQTCLFGFCPNCMWRYKRGKELANMTKEIERQIGKGEKLENVELPRCLPGVEYYSSQDYISFKSRELKYKELLDALKDDTNYITGLQGMGGTGKTTLATKVGKKLKQSEHFARVINTTVSFTPDIKKIQDEIAGPLGLKWEDCNESDRPKKLWSRLTNGEKILLILDDVWGHIDFRQIGIPHSDDHKGCRVLVTTRDLQVCNKMGCEKPIQLDLLSKEDAWIMFKRHARISDSSSKSLLEKGRKIADECKGLPIAIAAIASSLKGQQRREEWDVALKSLQKPLVSMHDVGDGNLVQIYKCLKFSYDYLKDEKAKGLFLLCSVFREDEEISTETLTRLGIGSGLFGEDYDKYDDARLEVIVAKNKLLDSCLLLKGNGGCVKMHDLVRDAAHWIAKKEIQTINLSNINQKSLVERENNIKYLLCEGKVMDVTSCRIDGSKLEILIVFFTRDVDHHVVELPNSFFENKAGLRVLHLSNDYSLIWRVLSLPQSFQSLANIRSLLVDRMILGDISILGNLQILETLDLLYCTIDELPHEITTLENFRLLSLKRCEIIRGGNPFDVIERCSSLEELYFEYGFERLRGEITFPMLQRFRVINTWHRGNVSLSKYVCFAGNEENGEFYFSEATFKYWMRTTEFLRLEGIHRGWPWRNLIPDIVPIDQGMNDLIELHLHSISQLQCLIDTKHIIDSRVQSVFSNLVALNLDGIENLEELCNGPLSSDSLKSLEELEITNCMHLRSLFECKLNLCNLRRMKLKDCPMLVSLFQLSTFRSLVLLEELKIIKCEQLKFIIVDERREEEPGEEKVDGDNDHKSHDSMFHKLKVLRIQRCPQLEFILLCLSARDLPVLETICITACDELKYIFGQHQDVELGSLKELFLDDLPNFINIFSECYHPMSSPVKESSSEDGSKAQIQLDPIKHNIFSWTHICCYGHKDRHRLRSATTTKIPLVSKDQLQDCSMTLASNSYCLHAMASAQYCLSRQPHILCNIKEMELNGLLKIKSVFILSIAPRMLLETLRIRCCGELKHIIMDTVDDNGGKNWGNIFPKLKELYIEDCGQLEYIFGCYTHDNQSHNEIHLHLPALEYLGLNNLPSLVDMSPKNYCVALPLLTEFKLKECSQVASKSIGDFINHSVSRSLDNTSAKDLSENVEHFLALKYLKICNSSAENIFCAGDINGQQMNVGLQKIKLYDMPLMTYLFVGPKNSFTLQNLMAIKIVRCENLKMIFSSSISRCLPQLLNLIIVECKELKQIIEEDVENPKMSNSLFPTTCFPTLQALLVANCNKLECVFPASICKELPKLKVMFVIGANALEEIFRCEGDQKVEIPNLKAVVFVRLSNLNQAQGTHFQAVENRLISNCPKLPLTDTEIDGDIDITYGDMDIDYETWKYLKSLLEDQSIQECFESETEDQSIQEGSESEKTITTILSTNSEIMNDPPKPLVAPIQKGIKRSVEEGTALANAKTISLSNHSKLVGSSSGSLVTSEHEISSQEDGDGQIAIPSFSTATTKPHAATKSVDVGDSKETTETYATSVVEKIDHDKTDCSSIIEFAHDLLDDNMQRQLESLFIQSLEDSKIQDTSNENPSAKTTEDFPIGHEVQAASGYELTSSQCLKEMEDQSIQEDSMPEKTVTTILSTNSERRNEPPTPLVAPIQKGIKRSAEEGTTLANAKTVSSSNHSKLVGSSSGPLFTSEHEISSQEVGDGQLAIPSFSTATTKPHAATKSVDVGDSKETTETYASSVEKIDQMIKEDPLIALEKLLTGKVSITEKIGQNPLSQSESEVQSSSVGILLDDLKTLMESSDLDHLVSHQESKSRMISLFQQLNQHQGVLSVEIKDFVKNAHDFFSDYFGKHTTSQLVSKRHNQLLESKTDLMNKLWSAKSTQTHIDNATSTAKTQIHEISLRIDGLRKQLVDLENQRDEFQSEVDECGLQKKKLMAECTQWAQQSKELLSELASSEVDIQEAERERSLAKEAFANLKSSFPTL